MIEKNLSKKFKSEEIGQLKKGEAFVKMVSSVFKMTTERIPDSPQLHCKDEIIASSRARYTVKEVSHTKGAELNYWRTDPLMASSSSTVTSQERAFLECVLSYPTLSVTNIYNKQEMSAYMGDKLKRTLKDQGLIHEITTHLGSGSRIAKFLLLTPSGFDALGINFGPKGGKGGTLHQYWQSFIRFYAEENNYRALIEEPISGGRETVDLCLEHKGKRIAVEISNTTGPLSMRWAMSKNVSELVTTR